jgi:putative membrane protein insertion efficiency factor
MKYILIFIITLYQKLFSPWLPPTCRFSPTCSQYAKEALIKYGIFQGFFLALKRLLKCHPFHVGGYDPVP